MERRPIAPYGLFLSFDSLHDPDHIVACERTPPSPAGPPGRRRCPSPFHAFAPLHAFAPCTAPTMTQDRAAFAGQIADVPVVELLQTILQGRHTGVARFDSPSGAATLWFRDGALVDADMGRHHMESAVLRLLALDVGTFEIEFKPISRRQVIELGTAELIAQAPPQEPQEDTDPRNKRPRRPGVSWHPTGGGRGRKGEQSSGAVPIVPMPTSSAAVPIVPLPTSSGAVPIVPLPTVTSPVPVAVTPSASAPISVALPESARPVVTALAPPLPPPSRAPPSNTPSNGTPVEEALPTRGRTMFGIPSMGPATTSASSAVEHGPAPPPTLELPPPSATVVGAPRVGLEATIPPLVASARRLEGTPSELVEARETGDRTWMRPYSPPDPTPLPSVPAEPARPPAPQSEPRITIHVSAAAAAASEPARPSEPSASSSTRGVTAMFFPPPPMSTEGAEAQWHGLPTSTERVAAPVVLPSAPDDDEEDATIREEPRTSVPHPRDRTVVGPAVVSGGPGPAKPGWDPPALSAGTMTSGSLVRSPAVPGSRPGTQRRTDERVAGIAHAIGLAPPPALPPDPRAVTDGVRLDQQVEAARAAGLTGASAPALVGRYEVLLRIARGGMGTVYLARITGEGGFRRLFALKVIRDHLSQHDEYVRMLLQEARIASRLHHPNVVGIVDIGTLANQHYLVMDYVEGCTFSELLKVHRRTRPPHLIVPIMLDALTGLHAAHTLVDDDGVPLTLVHCDFSPQNMLLGTNGIGRITDFGIARATNAWHERSSITRGKPAYVSPEQVIGRPLDRRSDVFSAGVVLWNALTGEQLFDGDSPERTLNSVLNKPIAPPSTVGLRPPSCFDRVCLRALQRDPDRRYQSAEEMLIELRRIAIAEDYLAPSSEVAQWVIDTFGRQLELRRQAAGISNRGLGDSQPTLTALAVPELVFSPVRSSEQTAETNVLIGEYPQQAYGTTPVDDSHPSRTALIRADVADAMPEAVSSRGRAFVLGIAVTIATTAIAVGIARPEWIGGGAVDDYGRYVAPAAGTSAVPTEVTPPSKADPRPVAVDDAGAKGSDEGDETSDANDQGVRADPDAKAGTPPEPVPENVETPVPEPEPPPVVEKRPKKSEGKTTDGERRLKPKKKPPTEDATTPETPPVEETKSDPPPPPDAPKHSPPIDPFEPSVPKPPDPQ